MKRITPLSIVVVLILGIVTFGLFPLLIFKGGFYIFADASTQILPFLIETKRMFASGTPLWSWNTYLGDNFLASFAYYTTFNPFAWINCLFPEKYMGVGFVLVLYLKFIVCGLTSYTYFRTMGVTRALSILGVILYVFSSWSISNLVYYTFLEPLMLIPLLFWSIEGFLNKKRYGATILTAVIFITIIINYYFSVSLLIISAIYFFFRLKHVAEDKSAYIKVTFKAVVCAITALMLSMVVILPVIYQFENSARNNTAIANLNLYQILERLLTIFIPEIHEGNNGFFLWDDNWYSTSLNISIFGFLPTLLYLLKGKEKWLRILILILLTCYFTPLGGIFSLFKHPRYTRWAISLILLIVLATVFYIKENRDLKLKNSILYISFCLLLYAFFGGIGLVWHIKNGSFWTQNGNTNIAVGLLLILNLIFLFVLSNKDLIVNSKRVIIFACITSMLQLLLFSLNMGGLTSLNPSNDKFTEIDCLVKQPSPKLTELPNYRTDFLVNSKGSGSCNFAMVFNRPSVETYHSLQNSSYRRLFRPLGFEGAVNFYPSEYRESFDALMSVKDIIDLSNDTILDQEPSLSFRGSIGSYKIYDNNYYVPLGYGYDKYLLADDLVKDSICDIYSRMFSAIVINKEDEREISKLLRKEKFSYENVSLDSVAKMRRQHVCDSIELTTSGLIAYSNQNNDELIFFSIPHDEGFTARIDGTKTKIFNANLDLSAIIVPSGSHIITFDYVPKGLKLGSIYSLCGLILFLFFIIRKDILRRQR